VCGADAKCGSVLDITKCSIKCSEYGLRYGDQSGGEISGIEVEGTGDNALSGIECAGMSAVKIDGARITRVEEGVLFRDEADCVLKNIKASGVTKGLFFDGSSRASMSASSCPTSIPVLS